MSSLEWASAIYTPFSDPTVVHEIWELWVKGEDRTAWYNLPAASIRKIRDRVWELSMSDPYATYHYKTLKEAKAMGIALYRMDNNG
jgi:hypothetical protein